MYDDVPDLPKRRLNGATPAAPKGFDAALDAMSVSELIDLRAQVEQRLPAKDLKDLDLARELVLQVLALQQMQQAVLSDTETPANQKAQVANSLSQALANLVKVQGDVYTTERLKKIEQALAETINGIPDKANREAFMDAYGKALGTL